MTEERLKNVNKVREKYIRIGFIKPCGIMGFFGVGFERANQIYNDVKQYIEQETVTIDGKKVNKKVSPLGIRTTKLLEYFEFKESEILRYASREEAMQHNDAPTSSNKKCLPERKKKRC